MAVEGGEGSTEGFMAVDDFVKGVVEGEEVEGAMEAEGGREVVGGGVRFELIEEPEAFLGEGEGDRWGARGGEDGGKV